MSLEDSGPCDAGCLGRRGVLVVGDEVASLSPSDSGSGNVVPIGFTVKNPVLLMSELVSMGMSPTDVAGVMVSYYNALIAPSSEVSGSACSARSRKSARTQRWCDEMAAMPGVSGYCYLQVIRYARRKAYKSRLGSTPAFQDFVGMLEKGDLDLSAARSFNLYRCGDVSGQLQPLYHVAEECSEGELVGSVYSAVACILRLYPWVNRTYQCEPDETVASIPLVGRIGADARAKQYVAAGSDLTVVAYNSADAVRASELSTPGGYNDSDLSMTSIYGSQLSGSSSSGSVRGSLRVTQQDLTYGRFDAMLRTHFAQKGDCKVMVVPPVQCSGPYAQLGSYILEPLRAELSVLSVNGFVRVATGGYEFGLDSSVKLILPRGAVLEMYGGKSAEVTIQALTSRVSEWWQRFYRPTELHGKPILPVGFNGVLSFGSFTYGWYDCADAMDSGEYPDVVPMQITEIVGHDFSVNGLLVQSFATGRFGLTVHGGRVRVGDIVTLSAGQSYYAVGVQVRPDTRVAALEPLTSVNIYAPLCQDRDVIVRYSLFG